MIIVVITFFLFTHFFFTFLYSLFPPYTHTHTHTYVIYNPHTAEADPHDGKRKVESLWPIFRIHHQRSRYIYELYYKRKAISKELYEYCLKEGYGDANLIAKWKKVQVIEQSKHHRKKKKKEEKQRKKKHFFKPLMIDTYIAPHFILILILLFIQLCLILFGFLHLFLL